MVIVLMFMAAASQTENENNHNILWGSPNIIEIANTRALPTQIIGRSTAIETLVMRLDELFDHAWSLNDEASLLSCRLIVLTDGSRFGEVES